MEPVKIRKTRKDGPEKIIQDAIKKYLEEREWYVIVTHGSEFQMGLPDLYAAHHHFGTRWVEVKNPLHYSFTPAQLRVFPMLQAKKVGIWIMTVADEYEYKLLMGYPNWQYFLNKSTHVR